MADPEGGAKLDLASLDLTQRRNHILRAALDALPPPSRQLLSTLALVSESVTYETLMAFNPHLPPEFDATEMPPVAKNSGVDEDLSNEEEATRDALAHKRSVRARLASPEYHEASKKLVATVHDLELRGLLQYDERKKRHDLHPVVRGVTVGGMQSADRERYGQRVVDHFSSLPHSPYDQAETLEDLRPGLTVVRTFLKLGHFEEAASVYIGDLANALLFNFETYAETLSLLRPFFPDGWGELPKNVETSTGILLTNIAAIALDYCSEWREGLAVYGVGLRCSLETEDWVNTVRALNNISRNLVDQKFFAKACLASALARDLAGAVGDEAGLFTGRVHLFLDQSRMGLWTQAEAAWQLLEPMGRDWSRSSYRPGHAEFVLSQSHYWKGTLQEGDLIAAERLAADGKNRITLRSLYGLRGAWRLDQGQWALAAGSFDEAARMARERGICDAVSETGLALAKYHLGQLVEPHREAERLAQLRTPAHRHLSHLYVLLGNSEQAKLHALRAYKAAWADGEPYVDRYELIKTTQMLQHLQVSIPNLPPYDATTDEKLPWEDAVIAATRNLKSIESGLTSVALLANQWVDFLEGARDQRPKNELGYGFPLIRIASCRLRNITVFEDTGSIQFQENGAMLLGDNATGKSTILKCLALASIGLESANEVIEGSAPTYLRNGTDWGAIEVEFELFVSPDCDSENGARFVIGLRIDRDSDRFSPLRNSDLTLKGRADPINCIERLGSLRRMRDLSFGFTCAYGPERNFSGNPYAIEAEYSIPENDWVLSLFKKQTWLLNPDTLMRLMRGDTRNFPNAPESVDPEIIRAITAGVNSLLPNAEIEPAGSASDVRIRGESLRLRNLSDGYSSVIAFVGHIIRAALRHTVWQQNPFSVSGILLIDEIDVHLHPAWQAHVYNDLQRVFTNLQIIASTHSPLVAGALDTSSVILLESRESKTSVVSLLEVLQETPSMKAWRVDQILTGPGFKLPTSVSIEAQQWENEFERLYSLPAGQRTMDQEQRLKQLRERLAREIPKTAESPIAREAATLFEEWAMSRLKQRTPEEIAALVKEAGELVEWSPDEEQ